VPKKSKRLNIREKWQLNWLSEYRIDPLGFLVPQHMLSGNSLSASTSGHVQGNQTLPLGSILQNQDLPRPDAGRGGQAMQ
jgi:hypothetical protein